MRLTVHNNIREATESMCREYTNLFEKSLDILIRFTGVWRIWNKIYNWQEFLFVYQRFFENKYCYYILYTPNSFSMPSFSFSIILEN